jgi:hypothetical protein
MTSVAPSAGGFQWQAVGQSLVLSLEPVLLR